MLVYPKFQQLSSPWLIIEIFTPLSLCRAYHDDIKIGRTKQNDHRRERQKTNSDLPTGTKENSKLTNETKDQQFMYYTNSDVFFG